MWSRVDEMVGIVVGSFEAGSLFFEVEDATKALGPTNGATLEKNGQILRVPYAKSILGPRSGPLGSSQSSSLAAAAIEAAAFAQQYDAVGWAPKEYNPDNKQPSGGQEPSGGEVAGPKDAYSLQSGFVWDEAFGYYYDASSGFYYDGNIVVDSEEFEPEALVESGVAHQKDNSVVKMGLEEAHRGWFN
ncbi:hypothetical protein TEA_023531 [Camellia sinensis var. sinensis]|uniref:OCRE domain-containing protein n=1 Tax=Camellia sinensis var. sinensis TaxID=542762 RepID=A0A4S4D075_CAMSN|nr:hypothetical protein TEA_023531 [Camellia sinensis var. sinensis]